VPDYFDHSRGKGWRNIAIAIALLIVAVFLTFLPQSQQTPIRQALRGTVLQPFIVAQSELTMRTRRTVDVPRLRMERDSLAAVVSAQASLAEENRRLRQLLGLRARAPSRFMPAAVIRVGTRGGESTFLLNVGGEAGLAPASPVIAAGGLLGVVWEVGPRSAQAIDWTHADFRASAMTADGNAYGIVEPRRGRYREEDQLALVGTPFHVDVRPGTRVVTSGRGGVYPRGILLGTVVGIEDADTGWRKSYLVRPAVRPEEASYVLVAVEGAEEMDDLSPLWSGAPLPDDTNGGGGP
jgi:rod shape-determining protein MreC